MNQAEFGKQFRLSEEHIKEVEEGHEFPCNRLFYGLVWKYGKDGLALIKASVGKIFEPIPQHPTVIKLLGMGAI